MPVRLRATTPQMTRADTAKAPHKPSNSGRAQRPTHPALPIATSGARPAAPAVSAAREARRLRHAITAAAPRAAATRKAAAETANGNGPTMKPAPVAPDVASDHGASWIQLRERLIAAPFESPTSDHGL